MFAPDEADCAFSLRLLFLRREKRLSARKIGRITVREQDPVLAHALAHGNG